MPEAPTSVPDAGSRRGGGGGWNNARLPVWWWGLRTGTRAKASWESLAEAIRRIDTTLFSISPKKGREETHWKLRDGATVAPQTVRHHILDAAHAVGVPGWGRRELALGRAGWGSSLPKGL